MSHTNNSVHNFGQLNAAVVIYLPTPPIMSEKVELTTQSIIEINGNHWRKIFTIIAKLLAQGDWRDYRDNQLLNNVFFCFDHALISNRDVLHCICGKAHWQNLDADLGRTRI